MAGFNPQNAKAWGRIGGMTRAGRNDRRMFARQGQIGLLERFAKEADPDGVLSDDERFERAMSLRKAHMLRLNLIRTEKRRIAREAAATRS